MIHISVFLSRYAVFLLLAFTLKMKSQKTIPTGKSDVRGDSLKEKFLSDSVHIYKSQKYSFLFALDSRNSFINSGMKIPVNVKGFMAGMVINQRHSLAIGFYGVSNFLKSEPISNESNQKMNINLKMGYATIFYEYLFIDTKRWQIGIPIEIGSGSFQRFATTTDSLHKPIPTYTDTASKSITLFSAGLDITFVVHKWLGLNAMGGYRLVGQREPSGINFNGVFYSVGFQLYMGQIYKDYKFRKIKRRYLKNIKTTIKN